MKPCGEGVGEDLESQLSLIVVEVSGRLQEPCVGELGEGLADLLRKLEGLDDLAFR